VDTEEVERRNKEVWGIPHFMPPEPEYSTDGTADSIVLVDPAFM
jgi:hypothetical protein